MAQQSICLSMIVKNEAPVIERCLASVLPLIDYWVICDTGSTDGTQDVIKNFFSRHYVPGELHERAWRDFAHNRTEALELAHPRADYTLIIDADDVLELARNFRLPLLKADSYTIDILHQELRYPRTQLVRSALPWRYEGVLHEFLTCGRDSGGNRIFSENRSQRALTGVCIRMSEQGARRRQSSAERYKRDAQVLSTALARETDPYLIARYTFYLAQSHEDSGDFGAALPLYLKRAELGFWDQEIYISLYRAARLNIQLQSEPDDVIAIFERASAVDPRRAEALHGAARFCRTRARHEQGFAFAQRAARLTPPPGALFTETWIYDYGALDELCVTAYWAGRYDISRKTARKLLLGGKLPKSETDRIAANARLASEAMKNLGNADSLSASEKDTTPPSAPEHDPELRTGDSAGIVLSSTEEPSADQSSGTEEGDSDNLQRSTSDTKSQLPSSTPNSAATTQNSNTIHVIGVAHTVPHEDYIVCAFTAKVLLFPDVIQPFGWTVVEYSNEGSTSNAREHVVILSKQRLHELSKRSSRNEPMDADVNNQELHQEFQRVLLKELRERVRPNDIVAHIWGPNMEVYNEIKGCHHVELSVGYTAWPGLPFRIYESSAWMHWHYGRAHEENGHNYKWVIPSAFDTRKWALQAQPENYAVYVGRIAARKGMNTLVEIARRMPDLPIRAYGPGDPSEWQKVAPPNLLFMGSVFGREVVDVVRSARCMVMPTSYIEPFGFSGIEAQLCGVPLISSNFGAFHETVIDGITGFRCNTLADWVEAIRRSSTLDRRQIAEIARSKYSKEVVGKQYDWVLRQLADLSGPGWYGDISRKFGDSVELKAAKTDRNNHIWLYMPYFGTLPNYFQLYLDSLARNADRLSVIFLTDVDLSSYSLPQNLLAIPMTFDAIRGRAANLIQRNYNQNVSASDLLKTPYKLIDFKITYPDLFHDVSERLGIPEDDFVGWGDCDLIYGRFSDFLAGNEGVGIIGGFHGHLTAMRNTAPFRKLYKSVEGLLDLLLGEKVHVADEIAFRKPLLEFLEKNGVNMFYINRYFCDVVPECFFHLFRRDHAKRYKNFFDAYNAEKEIAHVKYDHDGRLTVFYEDGTSRPSIYCHLQKRQMKLNVDRTNNGYLIYENSFENKEIATTQLSLGRAF